MTTRAKIRANLSKIDPQNSESLSTVENALFAVSLETSSASDDEKLSADLLHGDAKNRWYDKSFTYIAYPDGRFGMNFEHSGWDGSTVLNMVSHVCRNFEELRGSGDAEVNAEASVSPVSFTVDSEVKQALARAEDGYEKLADSTSLEVLDFNDFGKELIKTFKVSPDAFVQAAFHLAQKRTWDFVGSTYESCMTRRFLHSRTEAFRTVTPEVVEFVEAMDDPNASAKEKQVKMRASATAHVGRLAECKSGEGLDRHFVGLLSIWQRDGEKLGIKEEPAVFSSPGWQKLRYDILSTSRLASTDVQHFGFGPTTPDCTGIGYAVHKNECRFVISARKEREPELRLFTANVEQALRDMAKVMAESEA